MGWKFGLAGSILVEEKYSKSFKFKSRSFVKKENDYLNYANEKQQERSVSLKSKFKRFKSHFKNSKAIKVEHHDKELKFNGLGLQDVRKLAQKEIETKQVVPPTTDMRVHAGQQFPVLYKKYWTRRFSIMKGLPVSPIPSRETLFDYNLKVYVTTNFEQEVSNIAVGKTYIKEKHLQPDEHMDCSHFEEFKFVYDGEPKVISLQDHLEKCERFEKCYPGLGYAMEKQLLAVYAQLGISIMSDSAIPRRLNIVDDDGNKIEHPPVKFELPNKPMLKITPDMNPSSLKVGTKDIDHPLHPYYQMPKPKPKAVSFMDASNKTSPCSSPTDKSSNGKESGSGITASSELSFNQCNLKDSNTGETSPPISFTPKPETISYIDFAHMPESQFNKALEKIVSGELLVQDGGIVTNYRTKQTFDLYSLQNPNSLQNQNISPALSSRYHPLKNSKIIIQDPKENANIPYTTFRSVRPKYDESNTQITSRPTSALRLNKKDLSDPATPVYHNCPQSANSSFDFTKIMSELDREITLLKSAEKNGRSPDKDEKLEQAKNNRTTSVSGEELESPKIEKSSTDGKRMRKPNKPPTYQNRVFVSGPSFIDESREAYPRIVIAHDNTNSFVDSTLEPVDPFATNKTYVRTLFYYREFNGLNLRKSLKGFTENLNSSLSEPPKISYLTDLSDDEVMKLKSPERYKTSVREEKIESESNGTSVKGEDLKPSENILTSGVRYEKFESSKIKLLSRFEKKVRKPDNPPTYKTRVFISESTYHDPRILVANDNTNSFVESSLETVDPCTFKKTRARGLFYYYNFNGVNIRESLAGFTEKVDSESNTSSIKDEKLKSSESNRTSVRGENLNSHEKYEASVREDKVKDGKLKSSESNRNSDVKGNKLKSSEIEMVNQKRIRDPNKPPPTYQTRMFVSDPCIHEARETLPTILIANDNTNSFIDSTVETVDPKATNRKYARKVYYYSHLNGYNFKESLAGLKVKLQYPEDKNLRAIKEKHRISVKDKNPEYPKLKILDQKRIRKSNKPPPTYQKRVFVSDPSNDKARGTFPRIVITEDNTNSFIDSTLETVDSDATNKTYAKKLYYYSRLNNYNLRESLADLIEGDLNLQHLLHKDTIGPINYGKSKPDRKHITSIKDENLKPHKKHRTSAEDEKLESSESNNTSSGEQVKPEFPKFKLLDKKRVRKHNKPPTYQTRTFVSGPSIDEAKGKLPTILVTHDTTNSFIDSTLETLNPDDSTNKTRIRHLYYYTHSNNFNLRESLAGLTEKVELQRPEDDKLESENIAPLFKMKF